jgi:hypothetical protein
MNSRNAGAVIGSLIGGVALAIFGLSIIYFAATFESWIYSLFGVAMIIFGASLAFRAIFLFSTAKELDRTEKTDFERRRSDAGERAIESQRLDTPCAVIIAHADGFIGALASVAIMLNGENAGKLKNKQSLTMHTLAAENTIMAVYSLDKNQRSIVFTASSGGVVNIGVVTPKFGVQNGNKEYTFKLVEM